MAKAMANGLPMGALHTAPQYSDVLGPKSHASTFGGGPLVTRVALEVFDVLSDGLLAEVATKGEHLRGELEQLRQKHSFITEIRGQGLMLGMALAVDAQEVYTKLLEKRLLVGGIGNHTLRLLPPFIIGPKEIERAVKRLDKVFSTF
jgi:acetylornithine/succinyldiaminopimelate/putrescine aminotransferase